MIAKIITLATSKGGVGKSTLARNLGAYWANIGMKVLIIDADPQGSIINRHDPDGLLGSIIVIAHPEESVFNIIEENKNKYNYIIIDTAGFRNRTTVRALVASDLALIPCKPSADDVKEAIQTQKLINEINETPDRAKNHIKYRIIITMSIHNTTIAKHVRGQLEGVGYLVLKSEMYHRVIYPEDAIKGLSPCITEPDGAAARDISAIINEIKDVV